MTIRILIAALAAVALSATMADAAHRKHRHHVRKHAVVAVHAGWAAPQYNGLWADRCTTDDGYGRRLPCNYSGK